MFWREYVPVAERRRRALIKMNKLIQEGQKIHPVKIEGKTIARSFWGKAWCSHLEKFSDYENRLPRGRTYARNGSVCHLEISKGTIKAIVSGSELYKLEIKIAPLKDSKWKAIKKRCAGKISSMLELLKGKFSDNVMEIVTDRNKGLFPSPKEIELKCNCPDWAVMCKHVAAAMYGVGNRLDLQPELLFTLRGVDHNQLISVDSQISVASDSSSQKLQSNDVADIFDIDIELDEPVKKTKKTSTKTSTKKSIKKSIKKPIKKSIKKTVKKTAKKKVKKTVKKTIKKTASKTTPIKKTVKKTVKKVVKKTVKKAAKKQANKKTKSAKPFTPTGKGIERIRKKLEMTPEQFAKKLRVSLTTIHRWESTVGKPKLQSQSMEKLREIKEKL